jgi:hypothetical protein
MECRFLRRMEEKLPPKSGKVRVLLSFQSSPGTEGKGLATWIPERMCGHPVPEVALHSRPLGPSPTAPGHSGPFRPSASGVTEGTVSGSPISLQGFHL